MKHQAICQELHISYKNYTKLRNKYRFFSYITDILTLDYVLNLDTSLVEGLLDDLREILSRKSVLRGLDLAIFEGLTSFKPDNLLYLQNLANPVSRYQTHKWSYA